MLWGALRGDRRDVVRRVLGLVILVAATVVACAAILSLTDASTEAARTVLVTGGSALTLGFALTPLITGVDDPLDPRRFAVLGLPHRGLVWSIAVAGLVSVPTLAVIAVAVCTAVVWVAHAVPWIVAAIAVLLTVATCELFARVGMAVTALALRERRSRELSGLFILAIIIVVVPVVVFLASLEWHGAVPPQLIEAVTALGYTPLGAAWALPAFAAGVGSAGIAAVSAVGTLALLWLAWASLVRRQLTTTERPVTMRERGGLGWFAVAPGTPGGAIAARSLVYWLRDRRYLVNVIVVPVAALIATVPPLIAGVPAPIVALLPVPIMALFFGWLPHNDLAYDSTAIWMHIASGTRGIADRLGRLVPILLVGVPVLAVLTPVAVTLYGRWAVLPALAGVTVCLFLSGLGLSSIASTLAPYPVSRPGDSPFQQPQNAGSGGVIAQAVVLLMTLVVSAPALWWAWRALTVDIRYAATALWVGSGVGVLVLVVGVLIGSALFRRRGARLMEFASAS